jgi:hypothetical protein
MVITIYPPIAMNERGRRVTNQDAIFQKKLNGFKRKRRPKIISKNN